jgi:hypothetical protein
MNSEGIVNLIKMPECSHCGRLIPTDEADRLRRERGPTPLLCQSCAPSDDEINDLSDDDV